MDIFRVSTTGLRILETAEAMALPKATLSKVYAEFKYASFDAPNSNGDGFLTEDVTEEHLATLIGSPIYLQADAADHPLKTARASKRAPFWAGSIVDFVRREDGIWCVGAFQRDILEDRGIDAKALDKTFSVSMEVTFDRTKSKYRVGGALLTHAEALDRGVASPVGTPDDPSKYEARFNVPIDFHGTALLRRGRNADKTADIVRVAASGETGDPFRVTVHRVRHEATTVAEDDGDPLIGWSMADRRAHLAFLDPYHVTVRTR